MSIVNYLAPALIGILTVTTSLVQPAWAMAQTQQPSSDPAQRLRSAERLINQGEASQAAVSLQQATLAAQTIADSTVRDDMLRQISITYLRLENSTASIAVTQSMSDVTVSPVSCCTPLRTEAEIAIAIYFFNAQQDEDLNRFLQTTPNDTRRNEVVLGIIRAGADQGQVDRAIALLPLITDPQQTLSAQHTLVKHYGQAGNWNAGVALARQIIDLQERAGAFYTLTLIATQAGQYAQALTLAAQIELPSSRINALANVALAFSQVGDTVQAHRLMEQAYAESQSLDPRPQPYWIDKFAQIRAYDRAIALLDSLDDSYTQSEGRLYLARAYWQSDRLSDALELVQTIPDGQLQIPDGYPDPKIELIIDILDRAAVLQQPVVIDQGLQLLSPIRQVQALLELSQIDPTNAELRLEQALSVALTIRDVWSSPNQLSPDTNAGLLLVIAQRYADLDNRVQAQSVAFSIIQSVGQPADSNQTNNAIATLGAIARLTHSLNDSQLTQVAVRRAQSILLESTDQDSSWQVQNWLALAEICSAVNNQTCASDSVAKAQVIANQDDPQDLGSGALVNAYLSSGQTQEASQELETVLPTLLAAEEPQRSFNLWRQAVNLAHEPDLAFRVASIIPDPTAQVSAWAALTHHYATRNEASIAERAFTELFATIDRGWNPKERDHWVGLSIQQLIQPTAESNSSLHYELAARLLPAMTSHQTRASGLLIAQAAFAEGAQSVAESALIETTNAAQQASRLSWSTTLWENVQAALSFDDLTLAEAIAQQFDNPFYKINALRHIAHRYGRQGKVDLAIAALAQACQTARAIEDLPTRDQMLRAIATHQHWIER